ncbi:MAG: helix-turn-helix domain-containing protein [Treponema sp.]|jgi:excisionase family DNA binding protein|nr:helix-turn-helix domain-containing protein [Treponema sp.]
MKENKVADQGKYQGKMLTLEEAAKYIRMGKSTLYDCVNKNSIRCFRPPQGPMLFNVEDLDKWLDMAEIPAGIVGYKA